VRQARQEFFAGARATLPLIIGAIPFGIIFGVISLAAGMSWWATQAMSAFVFAGASQFIAANLLAHATPHPFIVLTTFIVNLRHALYGASVADYLRGLSPLWRAALAFQLTDESYATSIVHYRDASHDNENKHWYFLGSNLSMYLTWQIDTAAGYWIGNALGDPRALGFDFVSTIVFIAILIPQLKSRATLMAAIVAGAIAIVAIGLPNKLGLIVAMLLGIVAGMVAENWNLRS
jgi:4-azaleucine resistance transporter AzlC